MTPDSLQQKAIVGVSWLSLTSGIEIIVSIIRIPILARLLEPHDFGIFAIATLFTASLEAMSQMGFSQALIHKRQDPEPYLNDAWTLGVIRNMVMALLLIVFAPYVAAFFHEPATVTVIYLLAVAIFIRGFKTPALFLFQRKLEFKPYTLINHSRFWAETLVVLLAAFLLRNVYALALGYIANTVVWIIVGYYAHPYRPKFSFDMRKLRELYGYGKWITLQGVTLFISNNVSIAVLGRLLNSTLLGFYTMGHDLSFYAQKLIDRIAQPVMFPAYSKIQEDCERVHNWVRTAFTVSIILAGFIAAGLYATADVLVLVVLGEKWIPCIPLVKVLAIASFLYIPMYALSQPLFDGLGRPDVNFKLQAMKGLLLLATSIYAVINYGVIGAAWALLASLIIIVPIWLYYFGRVTNLSTLTLAAPVIVGILPLASTVVAQHFVQPSATLVGFATWALITVILCLISVSLGYLSSRTIHNALNLSFPLLVRVVQKSVLRRYGK